MKGKKKNCIKEKNLNCLHYFGLFFLYIFFLLILSTFSPIKYVNDYKENYCSYIIYHISYIDQCFEFELSRESERSIHYVSLSWNE